MEYENLPRLIALCGNPKAGKTAVQKILSENWNFDPIDDGMPMRRFAMQYLGLTWEQVSTQEGKASFVQIAGKTWQVRDILGQIGNHIEEMFGPEKLPFMATQGLQANKRYSFGSLRRDQGAYFKKHKGVVIGVRNPLAGPSSFEFDRFNRDLVDYWIDNDAQSLGLKEEKGFARLQNQVSAILAELNASRSGQ